MESDDEIREALRPLARESSALHEGELLIWESEAKGAGLSPAAVTSYVVRHGGRLVDTPPHISRLLGGIQLGGRRKPSQRLYVLPREQLEG